MKERTELEDQAVRFHYNWNRFENGMKGYSENLASADHGRTVLGRSPNGSDAHKWQQWITEKEAAAQAQLSEAIQAFAAFTEAIQPPKPKVVKTASVLKKTSALKKPKKK